MFESILVRHAYRMLSQLHGEFQSEKSAFYNHQQVSHVFYTSTLLVVLPFAFRCLKNDFCSLNLFYQKLT